MKKIAQPLCRVINDIKGGHQRRSIACLRVRGRQGKWLLKKAMGRYLPEDVLYRPKQGFVTPIAEWLRGPLAGKARGISKSAMLARTGWFDNARLALLAEEHIAGRSDHSRVLWQLLMLDRSLARLGIS